MAGRLCECEAWLVGHAPEAGPEQSQEPFGRLLCLWLGRGANPVFASSRRRDHVVARNESVVVLVGCRGPAKAIGTFFGAPTSF